MATTQFDGAFNDIGLVDLVIQTPMGNLTAKNLGPSDVAILATPGNDGNVMNIFEGSTGQLLANKSYKVKNWALTVRFLRHSLDYCRGTYLIQEILNGHITTVGIHFVNHNFGKKDGEDLDTNESLIAPQAFLVNFQGLEAGAGASGDFEMTFNVLTQPILLVFTILGVLVIQLMKLVITRQTKNTQVLTNIQEQHLQ